MEVGGYPSPGHLAPRQRTPDTHQRGDWFGPCAGLNIVMERNTSASART
jgi:hypothetical protein